MIIDGKKIERKEKFFVRNPYNNEIVGMVGIADRKDIENALTLSYHRKKDIPGEERVRILRDSAERIKREERDLAQLISLESGLCLKDTLYEIDRVCKTLEASADSVYEIEKDISKKFVKGENKNPELQVITEPLDLVVGITPFNHPMNQLVHKIGPAIAAGSSIVIKPSEKTPLSAIRLVEILHETGLPSNMVNLITTNRPLEFLDYVLESRKSEMISFTGSVYVGKYIARRMAESGNELIKYVPELGGNSPFIILDDAELSLAAEMALNAFGNSGQRCTKIKRILLHNEVAHEFICAFLELTKKIRYGSPLDEETNMGTVINEGAAIEIEKRVNEAILDGANLLYGNKRTGALYSPTILDYVLPISRLVVEETFGPVAPIIRIGSLEEAIEIINLSNYRLSAAVMTQSKEKAERIANALKVGQFNWNHHPSYRTEQAPFGGFRDSGNGEKEGVIMSAEGMRRIRTFYIH